MRSVAFFIVVVAVMISKTVFAQRTIDLKAEMSAVIGDPKVAVDLDRGIIVDALITKWRSQLQARFAHEIAPIDAAKRYLTQLPAERLYAAALADTFEHFRHAVTDSSEQPKSNVGVKALGDSDRDFTYTPLPLCRLVDTRGFGAPIQGGPFAPNSRRTITPAGACGIPTSNVAALLVSLTTHNLTLGSGGYISLVLPGAGIAGTTDVFGAEWSDSTALTRTSSSGAFDVYVNSATADVVIDVLGYFKQAIGKPALLQMQLAGGSIIPFGILFLDAPACPVGTTMISGGCLTGSFLVSLVASAKDATTDHWVCAFNSTSALTQSAFAQTFCLDTPTKAN